MGRAYPFHIVDVFAERPLAGNQLAVVQDAGDLTTEQMQAVALETNYSETTFVLHREPGRAQVRIFTPTFELPFAGHPTLGTAWVLTEGLGSITLDLGVGPVDVSFADGVGWMTPPPVAFNGTLDAATAASLIGLSAHDLDTSLPIELAQVGPQFVLIAVSSLAALKAAKLDADLHAKLLAEGVGVQCVYVFCSEAYASDADYACRMFFESAGVREDPATGSANSAFAAYLRKYRGNLGAVTVDQGVEINRPSRLYLQIETPLIRVGGKVKPVVSGHIHI